MRRTPRNTKAILARSIIALVAQGGEQAATIRAIADRTGVTEGAIYRHYRSKKELRWDAYKQIVEEMVHEKQHLMSSHASIRAKLHEWIRLTYAYFDRHPDAFTYVLLVPLPPALSQEQIATHQGQLFMTLMTEACATRAIRDMSPQMAMSHFTGVMLNVPRLINEGTLQGPASPRVDEVADSVWRILRPDTDRQLLKDNSEH